MAGNQKPESEKSKLERDLAQLAEFIERIFRPRPRPRPPVELLEPMYLDDFEDMRCDDPNCPCKERATICSRCHPDAGTLVVFSRGLLHLECAACGDVFADIVLARRVLH